MVVVAVERGEDMLCWRGWGGRRESRSMARAGFVVRATMCVVRRSCLVCRGRQGMNASRLGSRAAGQNKSIGDGGKRCERNWRSKQLSPGPAPGRGWMEAIVLW